jgi:hypothetical protein
MKKSPEELREWGKSPEGTRHIAMHISKLDCLDVCFSNNVFASDAKELLEKLRTYPSTPDMGQLLSEEDQLEVAEQVLESLNKSREPIILK